MPAAPPPPDHPPQAPVAPIDRSVLDRLFSATYEELRRLAAAVSEGDERATLNPTALVNEAYVRLADSLRITPATAQHFKRLAARAMRQVLVDAARRRSAMKRGGDMVFVTLAPEIEPATTRADRVLALDGALDDLARTKPRQAQLIEYRFFGGYDLAETAALLGVSEATVVRDWRFARAWLAVRLRGEG